MPRVITARFAFSFEFETAPPETLRGEVTAASVPSLAKEALKQALAAFPSRRWVSCVLVLDRSGVPGVLSGESAEDPDPTLPGKSGRDDPPHGRSSPVS
jgi:hypothetical protein